MRYNKPHLTFEQQAQKLIDKGLICSKQTLIDRLKAVSYYRLSAYWYPFRTPTDSLKPDTSLEQIWKKYCITRYVS
ncbi:MAG TPA: Abi family protein [Caldisericia bacterium]|nr:Abi family protein [Caldisericia bacterium]